MVLLLQSECNLGKREVKTLFGMYIARPPKRLLNLREGGYCDCSSSGEDNGAAQGTVKQLRFGPSRQLRCRQ